MAKLIDSKRAFLPKVEQERLMNKILSHISVSKAAKLGNLSERTIRDWSRGVVSMDYIVLRKLCMKTGVSLPLNLKLKDRYWYVGKGSLAGGKAVLKKYGKIGGDPEYRKKKWFEWWEREGKYKDRITSRKVIKKPKQSKELAEFVGIILGDGGITEHQVTVSLHHKDDKEYGRFVSKLIDVLFDVPIAVYHYPKYSKNDYVVSRTELVHFCIEKLGLKKGNKIKQQIDIPDWIKRNKKYSVACVRGLVDTDGSVFTHRYKVNGKMYLYKKLTFTSRSKPLLYSVYNILKSIGLNVRLTKKYDVFIDSQEVIKMYFKIVGSHNPKHLKRYKN